MPQLFLALGCNCSWIDGISCLVCRLLFVQCVHSPAPVFDKPPLRTFFLHYKCRKIHGRYYYFNKVYIYYDSTVSSIAIKNTRRTTTRLQCIAKCAFHHSPQLCCTTRKQGQGKALPRRDRVCNRCQYCFHHCSRFVSSRLVDSTTNA
jgi:hypothetical protein